MKNDQVASLFAKGLNFALFVNSLIVLAQACLHSAMSSLLNSFWSSTGLSVAAEAATNERYSGIFNQPAEAGIAYSIGGMAFLSLCSLQRSHVKPLWFWLFGVNFIVGFVGVSKVYVLFGAPVILAWAVVLVSRQREWRRGLHSLAGMSLVVLLLTSVNWDGIGSFARSSANWISSSSDSQMAATEVITGGRLKPNGYLPGKWLETNVVTADGSSSTLLRLAGTGLDQVPAGNDSGWLWAYQVGGITGLAIMAMLFFMLWWRAIRLSRVLGQSSVFAFLVVALATLANFGIPALIANRAGTILMMALSTGVMLRAVPKSEVLVRPRQSTRSTW